MNIINTLQPDIGKNLNILRSLKDFLLLNITADHLNIT